MKKSSKIMLVFACIFVTVTAAFLIGEMIFTFFSISALTSDNGWDAVGGIFLWLYAILLAIGTVASAAATLPFDIVLIKQVGKKWYNIIILIFTIVAMIIAVILVILLPIVSAMAPSNKGSSSSI